MEWKLEVVVIPVTDVDRAKRFYAEQVGFAVDHDTRISDEMRVVQLTPAGSACSIAIGTGLPASTPGSMRGIQLVVSDVDAGVGARDPAGRPGHRRRAGAPGRAGCGGQPGPALRR